ncbi:MAG: isocitrate/isopropylmalate family dehydrogenase, partial [Campylobacter hyointestinalis]
ANPIAMILSAAMMLKYAFNENDAANVIEKAVRAVLKDGYRTKDIAKFDAKEICTTSEIGSIISDYVKKI